MAYDPDNQVLRLPKKHASGLGTKPDPGLGRRLEAAQSLRNAMTAGLIAILLFAVVWVVLTSLTGRVFPWLSIVLGVLLGNVVRLAGKGLDWRFPLLAGTLTLAGALLGNVVISAAYTAGEFDTSTVRILSNATQMTWPVFFAEVLTAADYVYAAIGALVAAFYANRRLSRSEYFALRQWRDEGRTGQAGQ
jgi:hypothetical protein